MGLGCSCRGAGVASSSQNTCLSAPLSSCSLLCLLFFSSALSLLLLLPVLVPKCVPYVASSSLLCACSIQHARLRCSVFALSVLWHCKKKDYLDLQ